ncbi:DUF262 domain-containing protein [Lunatimonas salinarum]|uniref:DUF262 domain-containing protein n=1 Tax=Lunatimonas salinarum TaxID=1774590 RepID=UPI001ADEC992|nr:DUF262 domain-containing protein [Lunatimonas salinarum]
MPNQTETIRKFIKYLNNKDEQGGFWLPNIQRPFVWKKEQIERLYDSILREYPIGTLLIWKTKSDLKRRKFIDNYKSGISLANFYIPQDKTQKMMVLDGQQRLQSLFIGLMGSYDGEELYINILSGDLVAPEDIKFGFKFKSKSQAQFPFLLFKDLVFTDSKPKEIVKSIVSQNEVTEEQEDKIYDNVELIREVFCTQENILYQLVDSVDRPSTYTEEDIVEIFIRANSGGTPLGKSDLLFSLLTASWEEAENNMDELLDDLNKTGYKFDRDFILKISLVLLDKGAKYEIEKFRLPEVKEGIEENWQKIANTLRFVKDFIYGKTFLKTDKTLPSYASLIPIIYSRYHFPATWDKALESDLVDYLVKVNLTGVFGGVSDSFTDALVTVVKNNKGFEKIEIFGEIRSKGKSMELTQEALLGYHYSSKEIHLLFNLWYGFNYQPAWNQNKPQIDHIFPQSELKRIKMPNPETGKLNVMKYKWWDRDQIANLMLLTAHENGASNKTDILPKDWFADKEEDYLKLHLIPSEPALWELDRFEDFIKERRKLLVEQFANILYVPKTETEVKTQ